VAFASVALSTEYTSSTC